MLFQMVGQCIERFFHLCIIAIGGNRLAQLRKERLPEGIGAEQPVQVTAHDPPVG